jgi:addiction module HigA family antidote
MKKRKQRRKSRSEKRILALDETVRICQDLGISRSDAEAWHRTATNLDPLPGAEIISMTRLDPVHPGEILTEEFLRPFGITKHRLAIDLGIPATRVDQIAKGKRSISADTAIRLSLYFDNSAEFWMNLQSSYDLNKVRPRLPEIRRQVRGKAMSA